MAVAVYVLQCSLLSISLEDDIQNEVFDEFVFFTLILYCIN